MSYSSPFVANTGPVDAVVSHSIGSFSLLHAVYENPKLAVGKLVIMASPAEALHFIHFYRDALGLTDCTLQLTLKHFEVAIKKPVSYFSSPRFAQGLQHPGLIIHDVDDQEAPYETALALQKGWKNVRLLTTQGLSHNLKSPEVVAAVRDFIMEKSILEAGKEKDSTLSVRS